ncbi:predicted protein [Plenodomus lingam JN3]|uniref:Predicted protein n=1 Tax=Leptosphaeria maculans (strain JN3 / isolate v23.1.3 / race Av1-4-5-6-7-8) TaxID=985895 RepID=E4ZMZ6_LEPMJ|nr:predicted protein [Plenodomus lingam JN3]CBX92599.1 predicted protein [Plenodomus lingam JN3]
MPKSCVFFFWILIWNMLPIQNPPLVSASSSAFRDAIAHSLERRYLVTLFPWPFDSAGALRHQTVTTTWVGRVLTLLDFRTSPSTFSRHLIPRIPIIAP